MCKRTFSRKLLLCKSSPTSFRSAIDRCGIRLPDGQLTHVLRHTFASHFMVNGGNILTLQRILVHSSLAMTMKYAHLAPGHLQEAVELNPLSRFKKPLILTIQTHQKQKAYISVSLSFYYLILGGPGRNRTTDTRVFKL